MTPDCELLATFALTNSEDAFAEVVKRHVNLVYSAALRKTNGDGHLAKDVAQTVFTDLAKKANSLSRRENLSGWLYSATHFAAAKIIRTENRRRDREEKFMREPTNETAPETEWQNLSATLDDAMHELKAADRDAILLRYFENRPFAEVGAKLGLNENSARMRVERALERLRAVFAKRGIATTAGFASAISTNAIQIAPANLAATLTTTSLAAAGTGTFTLLKIMTMTKIKIGLAALVVAGGATALVLQQQAQEKLRGDNAALQQQLAQLQADNQSLSNRLAAIGDSKKLSDTQFNELLKLRGEVGVLRNQASGLKRDNNNLQTKLTEVANSATNSAAISQIHIKARFISVPRDGFSDSSTAGNGPTRILNYENFTNTLAMLQKRDGVEILGEPEITTTSGRQSQMRATQIVSVITNFALVESDGTNAVEPQSAQIETGAIIDVSPKILPDGRMIELPVTASITDFIGYERPTNNPIPAYTSQGERFDLPQVSPQFRVQESTAKVNVFDDQTLVFKLTDKQVPNKAFLNDPNVKFPATDTLVFVTVTIVDVAGNKKYKLEENSSVPDQPQPASN